MKGFACRAGLVALIACSVFTQGCLVPWKKHVALKKKHEEAVRELAQKESALADANTRIDQLRDQLKSKDQIIKLYEDKKKEAEELARRTKAELDKMQIELDKRLKGIADRWKGQVDLEDGVLKIKSTLLFALGSADISPEGQKLLEEIAKDFKATDEVIQVDGHTDNVPVKKPETVQRFGNNWGLSAMRAAAVVTFMAKGGIPEKRMYLRGFGEHRPRVPNTTDDNRSKNRRVELMFITTTAAQPEAPPAKKTE